MSNWPRSIAIGAALVLAAQAAAAQSIAPAQTATPAAQARQPVLAERIAAMVDDEPISTYDVRQRATLLLVSTGTQPTPEIMSDVYNQALRDLVDEKLKVLDLKRQEESRKLKPGTLFITEAELDRTFERLAQRNNLTAQQFAQALESQGVDVKAMREQIRVNASWENWTHGYFGRRIRISDEEIDARLREIEASISEPRYLVSEIFIDASRTSGVENAVGVARQLLTQLQQNARFDALARQYSALPTAANYGDAGWLTTAELEPEVAAVLEQMRPGQVSQPIPTRDGVYIVLLRERREGARATMLGMRQAAVFLPQDAGPQAVQAAQAQLMAVKQRANGCQGLEQAARGASGVQVTDLGQTETAELAPAFRQAVETLQTDQLSDPVRGPRGVHVIAVCNKSVSGADIPSRAEIEDNLYMLEVALIQRRELRNLRTAATISQPQ